MELISLNNDIVFAHNDLLLGNILYNQKENTVTFIDFEYTAYNYQAFDIANHFAEFAGNIYINKIYKYIYRIFSLTYNIKIFPMKMNKIIKKMLL